MRAGSSRLLAGLALALATRPAPAQAIPSAHWRSIVTVEGARPGQAFQDSEIWMAGSTMRIEERGKQAAGKTTLFLGDEAYIWVEGKSAGSKIAMALAVRRGGASHDYARRLEEIRTRGRKLRIEDWDGQACEVVEYETPQGKGTYWLARKFRNFPVRVITERRLGLPSRAEANWVVRMEYRNTDIRIPAKGSEAKLSLPEGVEFHDVTEMMLGKAPRRPSF